MAELFPANERNPRTIEPAALASLRASLLEFGDLSGFVLNRRSGKLVGAHQRNTAFADIEDKQVVIEHEHEADAQGTVANGYVMVQGNRYAFRAVDWDAAKESAAMIRANVSAGEFDDAKLLKLLEEVQASEVDLELTGFDDTELASLRAEQDGPGRKRFTAAEPRHDIAAELQKKWQTVTGQIWKLGRHLLMCGDSTRREDVQRLLGDEKVALTLTDPPYGIGENYATHDDTPEALQVLAEKFLPLARERAAVTLLTPGNKFADFYPVPTWRLCWFSAAGQGQGPWGFVCWHVILAYGKCPYLATGQGSRPDGFQINVPRGIDERHPCAKPLDVWEWLMLRGSAAEGDTVFDPFNGSGTTIIVAEKLKRTARTIEIDPKYVAVTLERWQESTGETAVLLEAAVTAQSAEAPVPS